MLKECRAVFKKILDEYGDDFVVDKHIPEDGTYILVDTSKDNFEIKDRFDIKLDKKNGMIEGESNTNFDIIRKYDYYSVLIEMNKYISNKKIHSNNYLSFFIKKETLNNKDFNFEMIDRYYEKLIEISKDYEDIDLDFLEKIKSFIKDNIFELDIDSKNKNYLKIFFDAPIVVYKQESDKYLTKRIFNNNKYNVVIDEKLYGLSNDNMGLNDKKTFLEHKTRKNKVPYLISFEEALLQKKFFDYLRVFANEGKNNVYINTSEVECKSEAIMAVKNGELLNKNDFNGIYMRIKKGTSLEIIDCDYISSYNYDLKKYLNVNDYLDIDFDKNIDISIYKKYKTKSEIQNLLDEVYFSKYLKRNYFTEAKDISKVDPVIKKYLLLYRDAIFDWIYKDYNNNIKKVLNKLSMRLLKYSVVNRKFVKAVSQFNLRWSFIEYFEGGKNMSEVLSKVRNDLKRKVNNDGSTQEYIESDLEYYFAVGQELYYLLSLNKSNKKSQSLINPFINAKEDKVLKEKMRKLYMKYNYAIEYKNKKNNNLYSLILGYKPTTKVNQDILIAGFLSKNLIYEKQEREGE